MSARIAGLRGIEALFLGALELKVRDAEMAAGSYVRGDLRNRTH